MGTIYRHTLDGVASSISRGSLGTMGVLTVLTDEPWLSGTEFATDLIHN